MNYNLIPFYRLIPSYLLMILPCFLRCMIEIALQPERNNNLAKISHWGKQWKISLNPDPNK